MSQLNDVLWRMQIKIETMTRIYTYENECYVDDIIRCLEGNRIHKGAVKRRIRDTFAKLCRLVKYEY